MTKRDIIIQFLINWQKYSTIRESKLTMAESWHIGDLWIRLAEKYDCWHEMAAIGF